MTSILIVDDEVLVRIAVGRLLRASGFAVELAGGADEVMRLMRAGQRWNAIVLDVRFANVPQTGIDVWRLVAALDPAQGRRVVWLSGGPVGEAEYVALKNSGCPMVYKPPVLAELLAAIEKAATR